MTDPQMPVGIGEKHTLTRTWNPVTEMQYATCSCGRWKKDVSFWDAKSMTRIDEIFDDAHAGHVIEAMVR